MPAKINLKGQALLIAIDTGLVRETETADGYDIAPFLRFWDGFSEVLNKFLDEQLNGGEDFGGVLNKERDGSSGDGSN